MELSRPSIRMRDGKGIELMTHYIALIHKDADSCYGVSFPDVPGVFTAGDTIDEAIQNAAEALAFAAEDWSDLNGAEFPAPRTDRPDSHRSCFLRRGSGSGCPGGTATRKR